MELAKIYEPEDVESRWYQFWLEKGYFMADNKSGTRAYSIVIPPPNVTGSLHMGHALNSSLQDVLARFKRMQGYDVLWLPGMDHAGIATQNIVEKMIHREGTNKEQLGRDAFIERVWKWKDESGGTIIHQLKRLGSSCDWTRERFTMDDGLSNAVKEVFVKLYNEGLIYRAERLINWCPRCLTALSDVEVEHEDTDGLMFYIKYPVYIAPNPLPQLQLHLTVATTRPETMLGDTGVAVHPSDERFKHLIGREVSLPLTNRRIPVIGDDTVDMEFGTGAVKVTPAHDFNDFDMGNRHGLSRITVFDERAHITPDIEGIESDVIEQISGVHAHKAREKVVHILKEKGLLLRTEHHKHAVGKCYRCRTVIEPRLSPQWYVKAKPLAESAIKAVQDGRTRIVPKSWENTYFEWMNNIRDWCISRQIWWGHQIPAWYCVDCNDIKFVIKSGDQLIKADFGEEGARPDYRLIKKEALHPIVSRTVPASCPTCGCSKLVQDEDVLDTWFSSALWPFSTLGWPERTNDLVRYYPTSVLVTGFDIIFFWVARMMMMGLKFMSDVPFRDVYIHALVRDAQGNKMSKSRGNVIDPLDVMKKYGTDAFRFTLISMAAQGRDIKLSEDRLEGYRNFANKLWNAARFSMMNLSDYDPAEIDPSVIKYSTADRWIVIRMNIAIREVISSLDNYRFNDAAGAVYQFVWHELCDWYIEIIKPALYDKESPFRAAAQHVLFRAMDSSLRLLHPFMPFITEEIWQKLTDGGRLCGGNVDRTTGFVEEGNSAPTSIMISDFPVYSDLLRDDKVVVAMDHVIEIVRDIRNLKAEAGFAPSASVDLEIVYKNEEKKAIALENLDYILRLSRAKHISLADSEVSILHGKTLIGNGYEIAAALSSQTFSSSGLDREQEKERLTREMSRINVEMERTINKLGNSDFLNKAPEAVIEKEKAKQREFEGLLSQLKEAIKRIDT